MKEGIRIQLEKELAQKFREVAIRKFNYGKGALSKAASEAIKNWLEEVEMKKRKDLMEVIKEVAGSWRIKESGTEYVRKIRKEWEKRPRL